MTWRTTPLQPPRRKLLAAACSMMVAASGTALAQSGQDTTEADGLLEEVIVTGFRKSIIKAMDIKRESTGSVDAIVAEDMADFPDLNLAESLQRVPGVQIRREGGEGRNITVRGLGPDFNRVRVNGMEGLGTSGGTDASGGANRSRQFDFNIFASELFSEVLIRKTAEASVDEGAIGATIDLRTPRPFDYEGTNAAVSAAMLYNDLSDEWGPRVSGLWSTTNADETFGVLFSASYSDRTIYEEGASTVRWQSADFASCSACSSQEEWDRVNDSYHPRIPRYGRLVHDQERVGITGTLQWRPSENTDITLDALYGTLEGTRSEQFLEALIRNEEDVMDVTDYVIQDGVMLAGTFDNTFVRVENRLDDLDSEFTQLSLSAEHQFADAFRMSGMLGTSTSDFDNPKQTTMIFDNVVNGYTYDYTSDPNLPFLDYGFDVTDPTQYLFTEVRDRPNFVSNDFDLAKLDAFWEVAENVQLSGGVNYKEYDFAVNEARRDDSVADILGAAVPVTEALADLLTGLGSGFGLPAGTDTSWVVPNLPATIDLVDLYNLPAVPRSGDIRSVTEETFSAYFQVDWTSELGGMVLRGNAGIRYYDTETSSTGILSGDTVTVVNSYDDVLPSLNLALDVTDNLVLRGSWAQVMTRPTLGSLTPGGSIGVFGDPTLSFGNPDLEPFEADAIDLSAEWYFMEGGALTFAYFTKDIKTFIARRSEDGIPFDTLGLPCSLLDSSPIEGECDTLFTVTRNVNGEGGDLDGYEIALMLPFGTGDSFMSDFGVIANYTNVDSKLNYAAEGQTPEYGPFVGVSEESWNLTFYYDNETFSARVSGNYRDDFLIQFPERGVAEATYWDFSSAYNINESWQVTFEVVNITDEEFNLRHLADDGAFDLPYVYHHTGVNYFVGLRWKL